MAPLLPWEVVGPLRINELTQNHLESDIYTATFLFAMNRDTYKRLPDDLKAVIDANSGAALAKKARARLGRRRNISPTGGQGGWTRRLPALPRTARALDGGDPIRRHGMDRRDRQRSGPLRRRQGAGGTVHCRG